MRLGRPRNTASLMLASHVLEATMKKMVFIAGALMLLAGAAFAGTNLAWNDCAGGGGVADRTAACTNTGAGSMFLSFSVATALPAVAGSDGFIDVVPASPTIAAGSWWFPAT